MQEYITLPISEADFPPLARITVVVLPEHSTICIQQGMACVRITSASETHPEKIDSCNTDRCNTSAQSEISIREMCARLEIFILMFVSGIKVRDMYVCFLS